MQPYSNRPDVFEIVIDKSLLNRFNLKPISYPWGIGYEQCCYIGDALIGIVSGEAHSSQAYYEGLKVGFRDRLVVTLVPSIPQNEYLTIPNVSDFTQSLLDFVKRQSGIDLICEADCGQQEVKSVLRNSNDISSVFNQLNDFLSGKKGFCPTFIVRKI